MSAELDADRCVEAVLALRKVYWTNSHRPLALWNPSEPLTSGGKRPHGEDWHIRAAQDLPEAAVKLPDPRARETASNRRRRRRDGQ